MKVRLRALAKRDLREAISWYRERSEEVASRFAVEVAQTLEHLERYPFGGSLIPGVPDSDARSLPVHNFPYRVVFIRLREHISVLAIAHYRRRPGYWNR